MIRPAIAAVWNHDSRSTSVTVNPVEKTEAGVAELTFALHGFFVATDGATVPGFARHGQFRSGAGDARGAEHTILLHPDAPRGQGTGRALMQKRLAPSRGPG